MSSFIINKEEYIKAAGLMYGIESVKISKYSWFMENIYKRFVKCYEMNVASVSEQYGRSDFCLDECDYMGVFNDYAKRGAKIFYGMDDEMSMNELRPRMMTFFNSVLYQIENEEMNKEAEAFFYTCTSRLYDTVLHEVDGWWGTVEL